MRGGRPRRPFPWDDVIGVGLGVLGFSPAVFWAMTPREFGFAVRARFGLDGGTGPISKSDMQALMKQFPD